MLLLLMFNPYIDAVEGKGLNAESTHQASQLHYQQTLTD
jgi:hypothetical protein